MDDRRLRLGQDVQLPAIHVHTMRCDASWAQDAELVQPLYHPHVVLLLGVLLITLSLGDMDVETRSQFYAQRRCLLQRGILERERRMQAEEGGAEYFRAAR